MDPNRILAGSVFMNLSESRQPVVESRKFFTRETSVASENIKPWCCPSRIATECAIDPDFPSLQARNIVHTKDNRPVMSASGDYAPHFLTREAQPITIHKSLSPISLATTSPDKATTSPDKATTSSDKATTSSDKATTSSNKKLSQLECKRAYNRSLKGIAARKRYNTSLKGRATRAKYLALPETKIKRKTYGKVYYQKKCQEKRNTLYADQIPSVTNKQQASKDSVKETGSEIRARSPIDKMLNLVKLTNTDEDLYVDVETIDEEYPYLLSPAYDPPRM